MHSRPLPLAGILFDKDGTLVDFHRTWTPVIRRATAYAAAGNADLAEHLLDLGGFDAQTGKTRPDSLFAAANTAEITAAFVEAGSPVPEDDMIAHFDSLFAETSAAAVPVCDTPPLFSDLRVRGLKLGIASSDNAASIARTATALGIDMMVDYVAGYDSGHGIKPHPGMVEAFCTAIGAAPQAIAMVGDNRHDMVMGRAAGVGITIAVLSGTGTRESLAGCCDVCLPNIAALPAFLDDLPIG